MLFPGDQSKKDLRYTKKLFISLFLLTIMVLLRWSPVVVVIHVTAVIFVVLTSCIPFIGNDPLNYQGRGIIAMLHLLSDSPGRHGNR